MKWVSNKTQFEFRRTRSKFIRVQKIETGRNRCITYIFFFFQPGQNFCKKKKRNRFSRRNLLMRTTHVLLWVIRNNSREKKSSKRYGIIEDRLLNKIHYQIIWISWFSSLYAFCFGFFSSLILIGFNIGSRGKINKKKNLGSQRFNIFY